MPYALCSRGKSGATRFGPSSSMRQRAETGARGNGMQRSSTRTEYSTWFLFSLFAIEKRGTSRFAGDFSEGAAVAPGTAHRSATARRGAVRLLLGVLVGFVLRSCVEI